MSFWEDSREAPHFFISNHDVKLFPPAKLPWCYGDSIKLGLDRTAFWYNEHLKSMFQFGRKRSQISFLTFKVILVGSIQFVCVELPFGSIYSN